MSPIRRRPAVDPPPLPPPVPLAELILRLATHGVPIHLYVHGDDATTRALATLATQNARIVAQLERLTMMSERELALLKRLNDVTNAIAAKIRELKDRTDDPEMLAALEAQASALESIAADPANPVPDLPAPPA